MMNRDQVEVGKYYIGIERRRVPGFIMGRCSSTRHSKGIPWFLPEYITNWNVTNQLSYEELV